MNMLDKIVFIADKIEKKKENEENLTWRERREKRNEE